MISNRRLAVVSFSDIKSSTVKMTGNEDQMMIDLHEHEKLFKKHLNEFGGRIVKDRGDGFMLEYPSAVEAVKCSYQIQRAFRERNQDKSDSESLLVRIGIHMGDVIPKKDDLFGKTVNIAARIEPLAEPGGISVSQTIYDSIVSALKFDFENTGPQKLKGIPEEVVIYKITQLEVPTVNSQKLSETVITKKADTNRKITKTVRLSKNSRRNQIVILPFKMFSAKDENFLSEGFARALDFGLSKEKQLSVKVISQIPNKGNNLDIEYIRDSLGADYFIEGSFNRFKDKFRININLNRVQDQSRLYFEEFTAAEEEIYEVQDVVIRNILFHLMIRISGETQATLSASRPKSSLAASFYLKGVHQNENAVTWNEKKRAITMLEKAAKADKQFALARTALAEAYSSVSGFFLNDKSWLDKAKIEAEKSYELDPNLVEATTTLGIVNLYCGDLDNAEMYLMQALDLRPDSIKARTKLSEVYRKAGRLEEARLVLEESLEFSKENGDKINHGKFLIELGGVETSRGFYSKAMTAYNESLEISRNHKDIILESSALNRIGASYTKMGKFSTALEYYEVMKKKVQIIGNKRMIATNLTNIAYIKTITGKPEEAEKMYLKALDIAEELGGDKLIANIHRQLGLLYNRIGRNPESLQHFTKSLELMKDSGLKLQQARLLNNMAALHCDMGDHTKALETYEEVTELVMDTGDYAMLGASQLNIGEIYEFLGDYGSALESLEEAEAAFEEIETCESLPYLYLFRGRVLSAMQEFEDAIDNFRMILNEKGERGDLYFRAQLYNACCNINMDNVGDWEQEITNAISELEKIKSYPELIESYRIYGEWLINFGKKSDAQVYLLKGKVLAEESKMRWELKKICELLEEAV